MSETESLNTLNSLWVYLAQTPLLWLTITLIVYQLAFMLYSRAKNFPLLNPVLIAVIVLVTLLKVTNTDYQTYFDGAQFVHFLLGPATVALAIPLYNQFSKLKKLFLPIGLSLLLGSSFSIIIVVYIAKFFGLGQESIFSLMPKSVTTPIAMGVSETIGGLPALTAVLVILTGIIGAMSASFLFRIFRIQDDSVQGFAIGMSAHGIGTARAFAISEQAGAFSGLAMALNAAMTALIVPIIVKLLNF